MTLGPTAQVEFFSFRTDIFFESVRKLYAKGGGGMRPTIWIIGGRERFPRYWRALENAGARPRCEGVPEDCAALLLPGGGDMEPWRYGQENIACRSLEPARDALELDLLERFTALRKPILGICRGMQSVNVFFGGTLLQDIPGHSQINGADRLHAVRAAPGPFAALDAVSVNSAHHQAVDKLGDGLRAEQWASDGVKEALRHARLPVWGVQWHPERLDNPAGERLFRAFLTLRGA